MTTDPYHINLIEFDVESDVLGNGAYSEIVLATHRRDDKKYALKVVDKEKAMRHNNVKYFLNERRVMLLCHHPRIIKLRWTTKDMQNIYFIYDLAPHGELWESLRGFPNFIPPPGLRRVWISQLISAIEYIHMTHSIAHRDLKPENILLDEQFNLQLCDFGTAKVMTKPVLDGEYQQYLTAVAEATQRIDQIEMSRKMNGIGPQLSGPDVLSSDENRRRSILYQASRTQSFTGTPHYMSPETIKSRGTRGTAVDLWALGVIIFQLETGQLPFQHESQYAVMTEVVQLRYDLDLIQDDDARDLVRQLLKKDPRQRLGVVGDDGEFGNHPRKVKINQDVDGGENGSTNLGGNHEGHNSDHDKDYDGSEDDDELYTQEIDPLTQKRRPKLLSQTTIYSTQLGWDAIKAHPYFTKFFNSQHHPQLSFNCNLPEELQLEAKLARELCFNFITYRDENGNEVMHPKQQLKDALKRKEELELQELEEQLEEAFPTLGNNIEILDQEALNPSHYSDGDDNDDEGDSNISNIVNQ